MAESCNRNDMLRGSTARQTRVLTNELGYKKNDNKCCICLEDFWYPSDDPSLKEQAVRNTSCRKVIDTDCLRLFLSCSYQCPICRQKLLNTSTAYPDAQDFANSGDLKANVKAFTMDRAR